MKFPFVIGFLCTVTAASLFGAQLKQAHVTQVIQDVKIVPGQAAPRPAIVNDEVREGNAVRTGVNLAGVSLGNGFCA